MFYKNEVGNFFRKNGNFSRNNNINYNILKSIYDNTKLEDIYEIFTHIPISEKYKFINGSYKYLRKITTIDDINI